MLHLLYILAFTFLAFVAVGNLIRNLLHFSQESSRSRPFNQQTPDFSTPNRTARIPHPELFDENGKAIGEPLLVMRSISVEDARQQLDALYNASPSTSRDLNDEDGTPPNPEWQQ